MPRWIQRLFCGLIAIALATAGARAADKLSSPAPADAFSIVVIPDSQAYRGRGTKAEPRSDQPVTNVVLDTNTQWIVDNLESQRIVFASHVGDIVDKNVTAQWEVARRAMDRLHGRVPYAIALGNHDMQASGDASLFQKYFPASRFAEFAWYGGTMPGADSRPISGSNADSFQLFSAGGLDFIFVHLECNAPDDVLHWADGVLDGHAQRRALVTTHMGLGPLEKPQNDEDFTGGPKGRMQWKKIHGERGNTPQQMWDKCFRKHANLFLLFCGDQSRSQAMRRASQNDAGKTVHELLSDYGVPRETGGYWLRICRFLPKLNRIEVYTFDSRTGELCPGTKIIPDRGQHQFVLDYDMSGKPTP